MIYGFTHSMLSQGSKYITHASESYDLFLTSAVMEGIKLWDLRTNRYISILTQLVYSNPTSILTQLVY